MYLLCIMYYHTLLRALSRFDPRWFFLFATIGSALLQWQNTLVLRNMQRIASMEIASRNRKLTDWSKQFRMFAARSIRQSMLAAKKREDATRCLCPSAHLVRQASNLDEVLWSFGAARPWQVTATNADLMRHSTLSDTSLISLVDESRKNRLLDLRTLETSDTANVWFW